MENTATVDYHYPPRTMVELFLFLGENPRSREEIGELLDYVLSYRE